ncbi:Fanconi anemia group D2 protein-like isoform X2 [Oscarella lobularis]|uniref:Fanconi anemia group D2 protein-like isoform X2 n=1 Tax=Oscarella lobularis TaxID=121494 RepID=UPI0033140816
MPLSKRQHSSGRASASKRAKAPPPAGETSLFTQLLAESSFRVSTSPQRRNELVIDQALFRKQLGSALQRHRDYPQVVNEFERCVEKHFEDQANFQNCLLPTAVPQENNVHARIGTQDSLVRILLGVDELQPSMLKILLEKLLEYSDADPGGLDVPKLVISQMQWLDTVVQSKDLADKLLEVLPVLSASVQKELIVALPEVLPDSEHPQVVGQLQELLAENADLAASIIEAMTNLNVSQDLFEEVRLSILKRLRSARLEDLPAAVRFIQQSVSQGDAVEIISELRENLDFESTFFPPITSTPSTCIASQQRNPSGERNASQKLSHELQIVETLRAGIRFQKPVADAWQKAIENVTTSDDHKVVDIFVFFILLSVAKRRKPLETLFRSKIKSGLFTDELLSQTFVSHSHILKEYLPSILSLSDILLRSPDNVVSSFGRALYSNAFTAFDSYGRQEIVGSLVVHIGSGLPSSIDGALDVLGSLDVQSMLPYAVFIKSILDYIHGLTLSQIRKLFTVLSALAFENSDNVGAIQDDVHIFVRKQLSSNNAKFKRIGVIGAIAAVRSLANKQKNCRRFVLTQSQTTTDGGDPDAAQQVTHLLELVRKCSASCPEVAALFYDELATVTQRQRGLDPRIREWICDTVVSDFQDIFVADDSEGETAPSISGSLSLHWTYGLDTVEEGEGVAVKIVPLLLDEKHKCSSAAKIIRLAPHFRLLRVCEQLQHEGSLDGIDALLGCPMILCKDDVLGSFDTLTIAQKEIVCSSLLYAINWCREVVSAFCTQDEIEMKGKVIARLKTITELEAALAKCMAATPSFVPPSAHFDVEQDDSDLVQPKKSGTGKGKGKKKNQEKNTSLDGDKDATDEVSLAETSSMPLHRLKPKPYFRELDLDVCRILLFDAITKKIVDSESHTKAVQMIHLEPSELHFILIDLYQKLVYKLGRSAGRSFPSKIKKDSGVGFSRLSMLEPKEVTALMVEILPAFCFHAEKMKAFFDTLMEENDGIVDVACKDDQYALTSSCFQLLFDILGVLFAWPGFGSKSWRDLFKQALAALTKTKDGDLRSLSVQELTGSVCQYLETFSQCVPKLSVAVSLTVLIESVVEQSQIPSLEPVISVLSGTFLKQRWTELENDKSNKINEMIQPLVRCHLHFAENSVELIETIAKDAFGELVEEGALSSKLYPTLRRISAPVYHRLMFEELARMVVTVASVKQTSSSDVKRERLTALGPIVRAFQLLIQLVKTDIGFCPQIRKNVCRQFSPSCYANSGVSI